jgi:hypothetical protein
MVRAHVSMYKMFNEILTNVFPGENPIHVHGSDSEDDVNRDGGKDNACGSKSHKPLEEATKTTPGVKTGEQVEARSATPVQPPRASADT